MRAANDNPNQGWALLGLLFLWSLTTFVGLGARELWNPVEPRYAGLVVEQSDHGLTSLLRESGRPYDQKPPLLMWAAAALGANASQPFGRLLLRLPSAIGSLIAALMLYALGARLFGARAAFFGASLWLTSWLPFWSSRFLHLDTAMTAASTAMALAVWARLDARGASRWAWLIVGSAAAAIAIMIKGPLIPLSVACIPLGVAGLRRDVRVIGRSGIFVMLLAGFCLAGIWFHRAWAEAGDAWAHEILVRQGLLRLTDSSYDAKHGAFYYFVTLISMTAPWSLMVVMMLLPWTWRRAKSSPPADREALAVLALWGAAIFGFLLLGASRRSRYLLPFFPPMCLALAWFLDREVWRIESRSRRGLICLAATSLVMILAALVLAVTGFEPRVSYWFTDSPAARSVFDQLAVAKGLLGYSQLMFLLAIVLSYLLFRRRWRALLITTIFTVSAVWMSWGIWGAPAVDQYRGDRKLLELLQPALDEGRELVVVSRHGNRESTPGWFRWYTGQWPLIAPEGEPIAAWAQGKAQGRIVVLIAIRDEKRYQASDFVNLRPLVEGRWGHARYRILVNP